MKWKNWTVTVLNSLVFSQSRSCLREPNVLTVTLPEKRALLGRHLLSSDTLEHGRYNGGKSGIGNKEPLQS